MKNIKSKTCIAGYLFCLMTCSPLYAADGYMGIGFGQSEINQGFFGEYGNGFKVFGGVRKHPNLAVEMAYLDFGNPSETLFGINIDYQAMAVAAWVKGIWPVQSEIDLFGKAGWAYWDIERTSMVFGLPASTTRYSGSDFTWGLGATFNYWETVSLQLEYEDINSDIDTITLWSISILYAF